MTKQETIQVLQSIEDRAIDFPNMTECDWVAIAAAKRHLTEEPVSEELEEAAKHYLYSNILYDDVYVGNPTDKDCIEMFKAGAEWQFERVNEALLSEVLSCFMHGGEADEVMAKLEGVLNQKK